MPKDDFNIEEGSFRDGQITYIGAGLNSLFKMPLSI